METYYFLKKNTPTKTGASSELEFATVYINNFVCDTSKLISNGTVDFDYRAYTRMEDKPDVNVVGFKISKPDGSYINTIENYAPTNPETFSAQDLYPEMLKAFALELGCPESDFEIVVWSLDINE